MKLEYLYDNNKNLKYTLKAFSFFVLAILLIVMVIFFFVEKVDYFFLLILTTLIGISGVFCYIIFYIIISLTNKYKRKQFSHIKNNGSYFEGIIVMANYHFKGYGKNSWLWKDTGDISVIADNKTYTITDIDYNNEFKLLEQKLDDNFDANMQQYNCLNQSFKNNNILAINKVHRKEIKIGIYVLDNKVIADFDSIKIN